MISFSHRSKPKKILTLRLKAKWWDAIASGEKTTEYRVATDYWRKRLAGRIYDEIHLWKGYPPKFDTSKLLVRRWVSVVECAMVHEEFGGVEKDVFCIDVSEKVRADNDQTD